MELNDPVFYDDAIWTQCHTGDEHFDESKYNSRTCSVCEDNEGNENPYADCPKEESK
jgi:hypothetical protein